MQSQRAILKIKSLCQQTSKPTRALLCMLRALSHVPGKAEAVAAAGWSQCDWPMCSSQVTPGDLFQGSKGTTAHLGCTSFCCPTLPPETAPLMASGDERPPNNTPRLFSAGTQWLMVQQDSKASQEEKAHRKATQLFSGSSRLLVSREGKKENQNSRLLNKAYFITQALPSKQREAQDVGELLLRTAS